MKSINGTFSILKNVWIFKKFTQLGRVICHILQLQELPCGYLQFNHKFNHSVTRSKLEINGVELVGVINKYKFCFFNYFIITEAGTIMRLNKL